MTKIKPVVLNGARLDLNGILIEVRKLKRKRACFVRAGEGSSGDGSAVLLTPALRRFLSAQSRYAVYLYWKITNFLQHFHR